jgi:chromosome segregation ATPase|eukprot:COSAG06_NODE_4637_length_4077_cov_2.669180_1_plen_213_part_00
MQQHDSMPLSTLSTERHGGGTTTEGVSLMEVSTFMTEQLKAVARMEARMDKQASEAKAEMEAQRLETRRQASEAKAEMEAQRLESLKQAAEAKAEMEVKLDEQRRQIEQQRQEAQQVREIASAKSCVSEGQLEMLQTRLDALHEAKLLTDDEVGALEDCVADYIDCCSSLNPAAAEIGAAAEKVKKMVGLSEGMGKDGMLARQLRRKFAVGQ